MCACVSEQRWPLLVVGNGTNVLYADAGVRGIVARMALNSYSIEDRGDESALLVASAGVSWPKLLNELAPLGWGGLEFGPGIPGTLGGGVISNAGAHHGNLEQVLEWVEVLDVRIGAEDQPTCRRYDAMSMMNWTCPIAIVVSVRNVASSLMNRAIHWPPRGG